MSIPYFRYVEYDHDGPGTYQCLSCYTFFSGCESYKFCPYCGLMWKGLLECRTHGEYPRVYALAKQLGVRSWDLIKRPAPPQKKHWIIECRTIWRESEPGQWQESTLYCGHTRQKAYQYLQRYRDEARNTEFPLFEYRAKLVH